MVPMLNRHNGRDAKEDQARRRRLEARLELDVSEYHEDGAGQSACTHSLIDVFGNN